jgi:integrase
MSQAKAIKGIRRLPIEEQASRITQKLFVASSRHKMKQAQGIKGTKSTGKIHSVSTRDRYKNSLIQIGKFAQEFFQIERMKDITPQIVEAYLNERSDSGYAQTSLKNDHTAATLALSYLAKTEIEISKVSGVARAKDSRAYTSFQVEEIAKHQSENHALATRISYASGIRAHELLTLKPESEDTASTHRRWTNERFKGREGERYIVTGKGGLKREVMLPKHLAIELEKTKLAQPEVVKDRGIIYTKSYNVGGGNNWSKSFTTASNRAIGRSTGAHGLRHSYAQERMEELQMLGTNYFLARDILSQELGHFRGDIVETYLR